MWAATNFKAGDYRDIGQAHADAGARLDAFDDITKIVARNAVTELATLQEGVITSHQVAVIASAIANALDGNTYGQTA